MRTMVAAGLTDNIVREILSGNKKTHIMISKSSFVQNYHSRNLTHISLPDNMAIQILGISTIMKKNKNRPTYEGLSEYTVFELGEIEPRKPEDTCRNLIKDKLSISGAKPCTAVSDLQLNGVKFHKGEIYYYKISQYQTIRGDRYLVFIGNVFRAGFDEKEFYNAFEEVNC